ncbi:MAG: hypothetical protein IKP61_00080, partial [Spirochaetales bacterium]|nr:hypothetical protein [Spirochaetales bacterium]
MRRISVVDCTLRRLSENRGLLFREKLAIAIGIDLYGADVIELPAVHSPKEDGIIFRTIAQSVKNAAVAIPVGDDVEVAASCIKGAVHPRLIVSLPVSTVQMEYMYRLKAPKMVEKIKALVSQAKAVCGDVEFEALDATRCEKAFLIEACLAAKESGATCVSVCDDAGIFMPDEFSSLVKAVKEAVELPLIVKVSDSISLAVADSLSALQAGCDGVKVCISSDNELKIGAFAEAFKTKCAQLGLESGLKFTELQSDIDGLLKKMQGSREKDEKPSVSGSSIFLDAESTLAQ